MPATNESLAAEFNFCQLAVQVVGFAGVESVAKYDGQCFSIQHALAVSVIKGFETIANLCTA